MCTMKKYRTIRSRLRRYKKSHLFPPVEKDGFKKLNTFYRWINIESTGKLSGFFSKVDSAGWLTEFRRDTTAGPNRC